MKKRRFGKRTFAAFLAASMILSVSTELVSAASTAQNQSKSVSEVADVSSTAVSSAEKSMTSVTVVAESVSLNAVKLPSGLKGEGTKSNPYQIANIDDLLRMNDYINYEKSGNKYFELTSDVDLSLAYFPALDSKDFAKKSDFVSAEGIYSIVSALASLSGNANVFFRLNGNGYSFKNLNVTVPSGVRAAAVFGYVGTNSVIENVSFENCRITVNSGTDGAYGLVAVQNLGTIRDVTVSNCVVDARQSECSVSEDDHVSLECGKVCKGVSLVVAENSGLISAVSVKASDSHHGIFVKDAVRYVGAVAGQNRKSVSGTSVSGVRILAYGAEDDLSSVSGNGAAAQFVGMIAGSNGASDGKSSAAVSDCVVELTHGSDMMFGDMAGGLVGLNYGLITKSYVKGTCTDAGSAANIVGAGRVGGLAGVNHGSIVSCGSYDVGFAFAKHSANNRYGGIVSENDGSIRQSVASGHVYIKSEKDSVGGIVASASSGTVSQTYSFVSVSSDTSTSGAIFGCNAAVSSIGTDNYWVGASQGFGSAVPSGGAALNTLQSESTLLNIPAGDAGMSFTKTSLSHTWSGSDAVVTIDLSKPVLSDTSSIRVEKSADSFTVKSDASGSYGKISYSVNVRFPDSVGAGQPVSVRVSVPVLVTDSANRGAGLSVSNPIILTSYEQFKFIRVAPNAHYRLGGDIVVCSDWDPIAFSGTLNGAGHSVTVSGGLFSVVSGSRDDAVSDSDWAIRLSNVSSGSIRNLTIYASGTIRGSVFGSLDNATLDKITYTAVGENDFAVLSAAKAGALADLVSGNVYLHNCYVSVPVTVTASASEGIGALAGFVAANVLRVDNCGSSSVIAIDGHNLPNVGGLFGYISALSDGEITNCFASGSVYVKPVVDDVKANIVIGGVAADAENNLKTDNCYYSVAESAVSGGSVALDAADITSDGIVSLSASQKTYSVDPEGKEETEVVVSLPQCLDACQNVQPEDFTFVFEDEQIYISTEADTSGSEVTIGVMAEDTVEVSSNSSLTVIHEPTGLKITEVMSSDPESSPDEVDGYWEIYSVSQWEEVAAGWGTDFYETDNYKLCADLDFDGDTITPWGSDLYPFSGEFTSDDKYTISNGEIDGKGLFEYTQGATFSNFALDGITVSCSSGEPGVAVLVGTADLDSSNGSTSFSDIDISNCTVVSDFESSLDIENDEVLALDAHTAQVGTLAGVLNNMSSADNYLIQDITVTDCSVSATGDYAFAVGGLIGLAYCATGTTTTIGASDDDPSIVISGVEVEGYASVGGVIGMAGDFPVDADYGIGEFDALFGEDRNDYLGTLEIINVSVDDSDISASDGTCGGIIGSELVGFIDFQNTEDWEIYCGDAYSSISECSVSDSTIISNASLNDVTEVSAMAACGGIAGYCGGTVSDCTVTDCVIRSATAAGIVGRPARKNYQLDLDSDGFMSGCSLSVENCNVLGSSTMISNVTGTDALHLGGIVATAMNTNLTITDCGIGEDVNISGAAQYIGGFIGYVYSLDYCGEIDGNVAYYVVRVEQSVFAGNIQLPSAASISNSAVGGCVGYAHIIPEALRIQNDYFGGNIQNPGGTSNAPRYCAGVIGWFSITDPDYFRGNYYGSMKPFIVGCAVASLLNNGAANSNYSTCKMIACLGDSSTSIFDDTAADLSMIVYDNILSSYPQDCSVYGDFYDDENGSRVSIDPDYYPGYLDTYCDINRPQTYNQSDANALAAAKYFNGKTPAQSPWALTGPAQSPSASVTFTVDTTGNSPFIKFASVADSNSSTTFSSFLGTVIWRTSSVSVLEINSNSYNSNHTLTVTGRASSGASPVYAVGEMGVLYSDNGYQPHILPGTNNMPATICVGAPFSCSGFTADVTWDESDGWWLIPDVQHLKALEGRITNSSLSHQNYVVTANINLQNETFSPITGTFTGQFKCNANCAIQNWTYSATDVTSVGLFAAADGATFTNVTLTNFNLSTSASSSSAGALVGTVSDTTNRGTTFSGITVTNSTISASDNAGVLVGTADNTVFTGITISNSTATASEYSGVVAAYVTDSKVTFDSVTYGTTFGAALSGDTVGSILVSGNPTDARYVGGVFGHASGSLSDSVIQGVTVANLTAKSYSSNNTDFAAGIAAEYSGAISSVTVQNTPNTPIPISGSSASGVVGKTVGNTSVNGANLTDLAVQGISANVSYRSAGVVALHATGTLSVSNCTVKSAITSNGITGGIVAEMTSPATITGISGSILGGSLTTGSSSLLVDSYAVGGLIGLLKGSAGNSVLSDTVFYSTMSGLGCKGAAVGKVVDANGDVDSLNTTPVINFYYSTVQTPGVVVCGSSVDGSPSFACSTFIDLQTQMEYTKDDDVCQGKTLEFIDYSQSTYTVDPSAFSFPTGSTRINSETDMSYKAFKAPSSVDFVLSNVSCPSGISWNISGNNSTITLTDFNGTGTVRFTYANGIQITFGIKVSDIGGDGSQGSPYRIEKVGQLSHLADPNKQSAYFEIAPASGELDLTEWSTSGLNSVWGDDTLDNPWIDIDFTGTIDGNHCTISNLTITNSTRKYTGFFCKFSGTLKDITFTNCSVSSTATDTDAGTGIVAGCMDGTLENVEVYNSNVSGARHVGGVVGVSFGTIRGCKFIDNDANTTPPSTVKSLVYDANDAITGGHCAGGIIGGGFNATSCTVSGVRVWGYDMAGGISGGTLSFYDEVTSSNFGSDFNTYQNSGKAMQFHDDKVINTEVKTAAVSALGYAGGILGIAETGNGTYRAISIKSCSVDSDTTVTADAASGVTGQSNYAGGVMGFMDEYYGSTTHNVGAQTNVDVGYGFLIDNCTVYASVTANGTADTNDLTSAGGLVGATAGSGTYKFRQDANGALQSYFYFNVVNATVSSAKYGGGLFGRFAANVEGASAGCRLQVDDNFICKNIISVTLARATAVAGSSPSSEIDHMGVVAGYFRPNGSATSTYINFIALSGLDNNSQPADIVAAFSAATYSIIKENYYSSDVSCSGSFRDLSLFSAVVDDSIIAACGVTDVAKTVKNGEQVGSLTVSNGNDGTFQDYLDGRRSEDEYPTPVRLKFRIAAAGSTVTESADLGAVGSAIALQYGGSASQADRSLTLNRPQDAEEEPIWIDPSDSAYFSSEYDQIDCPMVWDDLTDWVQQITEDDTWDGDWSALDAEDKAALIARFAAVGYTVTVDNNGVTYLAHASQFTIASDADECEDTTYLVADLGYGLLVKIKVWTDNDTSAISITSAADFALYFFGASTRTSNSYLYNNYRQTVDLRYSDIVSAISALSTNADPDDPPRSAVFEPIGSEGHPFRGSYDGDGHRIVGFTYDGSERLDNLGQVIYAGDKNVGLFGYVGSSGQLRNIHIELAENGVVGGFSSEGSNIGGLVGYYGGSSPIVNCSVLYGKVYGKALASGSDRVNVGGLVGATSGGTLQYCFTSTDVRVENNANQVYTYAAGGLVGFCETGSMTFDRCFTSSDIVGSASVGALLGKIYQHNNNTITIRNCFSTASVTSMSHLDGELSGYPVPLVTGYKQKLGGASGQTFVDKDGAPYVSAQNLYVAGPNTSEYNSNFYYVSLFGLCAVMDGSSNIYYDAQVIGRLNFTTRSGNSGTVGYIRVNGSLYNRSNGNAMTNDAITAMCKKTAYLTDTSFSGFDVSDSSDPPEITESTGSKWITGLANLYPVLIMKKYTPNDPTNSYPADEYSQAVAKVAAMPIFPDPRESDDSDANRRDYTGLTYPVSIPNSLDGASITHASSAYSASQEHSDTDYPNGYDVNLKGGTITSGNKSWTIDANNNWNYTITTDNGWDDNKKTDFLFKAAADGSEASVIRNVNLGSDSNASRDLRTPCVYVWGSVNGALSGSAAPYTVYRSIRIPLRSEENRVYVATERQLRAIQGIRSATTLSGGSSYTETADKFVNAYRDVAKAPTNSTVPNTGAYNNGKDVLICADIELNKDIYFNPIQNYERRVVGTTLGGFDGGNCEISNMTINLPASETPVGMFSTLGGGAKNSQLKGIKLQNIILRDVRIDGNSCVGALVGEITGTADAGDNESCEILNCMVKTTDGLTGDNLPHVAGRGNYVGGLVGKVSSTMINYARKNDYSNDVLSVSVSLDNPNDDFGVAIDKYTGADVSVSGCNNVGGLIGAMNKVSAINCFASGSVSYNKYTSAGGERTSVSDDSGFDTNSKKRLAYGGFVGILGEDCISKFCFASGNVNVKLPEVNNNTNGTLPVGIGGFAGASTVSVSDCFSTGDVDASVTGYHFENPNDNTTILCVGGLVGYTSSNVENAYSTSAVSCSNAPVEHVKIGIGGVVGYADDSSSHVSSVYSSGSVSSTKDVIDANDLDASARLYIGGAAGYVEGSAEKAYFDLWTNHIANLKAVGNKDEGSALRSFTTDEFCTNTLSDNSALVGGSVSSPLSSSVWGVAPSNPDDSETSPNTYPYLKAFFNDDNAVSNYIRFPAALSVAAVRPNDRDTSARSGEGYSMAVTIPAFVQVTVMKTGENDKILRYYLDSTDDDGNAGTVKYGEMTYAPKRQSNGSENVRMLIWVKSYSEFDNAQEIRHIGFYEQTSSGGLVIVADDATPTASQIKLTDVQKNAKETYVPRIGQRVKLSNGYKEYGVRSVQRAFRLMLGTSKYPYLITNVDELNHIYFASNYSLPSPDTYYDHWYSQQQVVQSDGNSVFANVECNSDETENPSGDNIVHYRLMINIDMSGQNDDFTAIGNRDHAVLGKAFNGYELDGNDYAIVNYSKSTAFITELDSKSTVKNLVFSSATLGGTNVTGDLALIGTNYGRINGLMLLEKDVAHPNAASSVTTSNGNAAGLVGTNYGTITQSVVQGTITGGGADKYVGGIAAINNGLICDCVSAANIVANEHTVGIGGLVGQNNNATPTQTVYRQPQSEDESNTLLMIVEDDFVKQDAGSQYYLSELWPLQPGYTPTVDMKYVAADSGDTGRLEIVSNDTEISDADADSMIHLQDVTPVAENVNLDIGDFTKYVGLTYAKATTASASVFDSFTLGSVTGSGDTFVGGLVGENNGSVEYAYSRTEVSGAVGKTGSFVGKNARTIKESFSAGKTTVSGTNAHNDFGSAFVGTTDGGTLTNAYADKALMTSASFMLLGDAEVTEKIIDLSCFSNTGGRYTATKNTTVSNTAVEDGYPRLTSIMDLSDVQTYKIGNDTGTYKMLKVRLLQGYSQLAAVTLDSPAGNYVDTLPSTAIASYKVTGDFTVTENQSTITECDVTDDGTNENGSVSAQTLRLTQKIGAGSVTTDDLKYVLKFSFLRSIGSNPNFQSGVGIVDNDNTLPYIIGANSTSHYSKEQSFASLAYFGRAADANFKLLTDVAFGGTTGNSLGAYPITVFRGKLDGNVKTVSDLELTSGGLFGKIESDATIKNLGLVGVDLTVTPTAAGNYGLLANEVDGATDPNVYTVQNVYAVGELKVAYPVPEASEEPGEGEGSGEPAEPGEGEGSEAVDTVSHYMTNVGGLIGKSNNAKVTKVVTSGYIRNDSVADPEYGEPTVGGVIGAMNGGSLTGAESTAYVYGEAVIGGIVGAETGDSSISDAIFAGTAADAYMTDNTTDISDAETTAHFDSDGNWIGNQNWKSSDSSKKDPAKISHILASSDNGENKPITRVYYDNQIALFKEDESIEKNTSSLSRIITGMSLNGFQVRGSSGSSYPYYLSPITGLAENAAFKTGLNFALAHINVQLASSSGNIACYDEVSVTSPVNTSVQADTVALTENRDRFDDLTAASYLTQNGVILEPNGGTNKGYTGVKATLNRGTGATFANSANTANEIYRYIEVNIVRVVTVTYEIVKESGVSLDNRDKIGLMLQPSLSIPVSASAITSVDEDANTSNGTSGEQYSVRFHKLVLSGDTINVYTQLPNGLDYYVSRTVDDPQAEEPTSEHEITVNADEDSVYIKVHVKNAVATWGLQNRNGVVTPVQ